MTTKPSEEGTDAAPDVEVAEAPFPALPRSPVSGSPLDLDSLLDIPVTLSVELGRVRVPLDQVMRFAPGSLIELAHSASEPADVLVNGTRVARAEIVTVGEKYGIRILELVSPEERLKRVAR